jgi:hypothetical protein
MKQHFNTGGLLFCSLLFSRGGSDFSFLFVFVTLFVLFSWLPTPGPIIIFFLQLEKKSTEKMKILPIPRVLTQISSSPRRKVTSGTTNYARNVTQN